MSKSNVKKFKNEIIMSMVNKSENMFDKLLNTTKMVSDSKVNHKEYLKKTVV